MPARYREKLGTGSILTLAPGGRCLLIYPALTWQSVDQKLRAVPRKDDAHWDFVRKFTANAIEAEFDGQGRVLLPVTHRARVGIERDVVFIGAISRLELWAKDRVPDLTPTAEDLERAAELGLD